MTFYELVLKNLFQNQFKKNSTRAYYFTFKTLINIKNCLKYVDTTKLNLYKVNFMKFP